jgi:hypothetical protein
MREWAAWHFEHSELRGVHIDIRFNRPVRPRDIERIERLCAFWREVAAAEEEGATLPVSAPDATKPSSGDAGEGETR